ncbi:hypothetical protein CLI71_05130 [Prevotella intermedia]|uniref:Uncharacterized protein n=1 Tax=Prevotella intermedia TaxID=28131 RepID=A0A2A6EF32_PREIN|nr:hypothetical protein CLI71_05130 [Prevotella intermedia]
MKLKTVIAECTVYNFKIILEEKKLRNWLKSIITFTNGLGKSLLLSINNDRMVKRIGLYLNVGNVIT